MNKLRVKIIEDCREVDNKTDGQMGILLGVFPYLDLDGNFTNPKIQLDSGEIIWGAECWWTADLEATDQENIDEVRNTKITYLELINILGDMYNDSAGTF